jgi:uncharacterized protein
MPAERTPHADDSLLSAPLLALTQWTLQSPATVLVGACGLALLCFALTLNGLTFKTSRLDLLNPRSEYNRRWLAYLDEFGDRDDACVVVSAERPTDLAAAIDDVAAQLKQEPKRFESVFYRRDLSRLKAKALHYLPAEQLAQLEQQVAQASAMLPGAGEPADPAEQLAKLNEELAQVGASSPARHKWLDEQYAKVAGLLLAGLSGAPISGGQAGTAPSNLSALEQFDAQYLLADGGKIGFILMRLKQASDADVGAAEAIARLRAIVKQTQTKHQRAWLGVTGLPVIEHDEMAASQFDMLWTSVASMLLVLLLYLAAYGGLRHAMLVNGLLLLGTAYSFGFATLAVGHLNILSAAFSAVLIGLGIDFAIHYVATYLNLRRHGCDEETALLRMAVEVGPGVVTGGVTTAAAFFMAAMTDFIGIRELGLVAGGGILLCVLSTVVVLPPLILVVDRRWPLVELPGILPAGRWFVLPVKFPRLAMLASLVVTAIVSIGAVNIRYDHNLLNLQPRHLESADIERQLFTRLDDSVWYAVSVCQSRDELRRRKAAFEALPVVGKTEEIASLLPDRTPAEAARIERLCRQIAALPQATSAAPSGDFQRLQQEIQRAGELVAHELPPELMAGTLLHRLRGLAASMPQQELAARLMHCARAIQHAQQQLAPIHAIADAQAPRLDDLPRELADRFVGKNKTYLLKVYARGNIWDMERLERFVRSVESVDAHVTGHPVQTYYASRHMQSSYLRAGLYALVAVLILLWIDFRSLAHSLLAMVPLVIGFATMCGCLGWLDIPFNPANMIVLPLILGIGVDHGVHLVHVWRQQRGRFVLGDATTVAVLLTASTTTASFGALILARHQGLQSLGQVLTIGVTTCLAASIVFFPSLLSWLTRNRPIEAEATHGPPDAVQTLTAADVAPQPAVTTAASSHAPDPPTTPPAALPESVSLTPLPVTDEEIAALLDSAFLVDHIASAAAPVESESAISSTSEPLRRRNVPRRSEAA